VRVSHDISFHYNLSTVVKMWHLAQRQPKRLPTCQKLLSSSCRWMVYSAHAYLQIPSSGHQIIRTTFYIILMLVAFSLGYAERQHVWTQNANRQSQVFVQPVIWIKPFTADPVRLRLHTLPYWSNPPFLVCDTRELWRSGLSARAPECQESKMMG